MYNNGVIFFTACRGMKLVISKILHEQSSKKKKKKRKQKQKQNKKKHFMMG